VRRNLAGVAWGLAAGAGFALFLICLNRAGSTSDLWPVGVSDSAGLVTALVIAAVAGELDLPPAGTRRLSLLSGLVAGAGTLAIFLASHYGLLAVTAVIYSLYPAGTIILARILSHERLTKVGLCGLCLGAVSVSLIAAGAVR
jgi:drug/metabolite transporter (DMT)-like permease